MRLEVNSEICNSRVAGTPNIFGFSIPNYNSRGSTITVGWANNACFVSSFNIHVTRYCSHWFYLAQIHREGTIFIRFSKNLSPKARTGKVWVSTEEIVWVKQSLPLLDLLTLHGGRTFWKSVIWKCQSECDRFRSVNYMYQSRVAQSTMTFNQGPHTFATAGHEIITILIMLIMVWLY